MLSTAMQIIWSKTRFFSGVLANETKPLAVGRLNLLNSQRMSKIKFTICSKPLVFAVEVLFHILGGREVKRAEQLLAAL